MTGTYPIYGPPTSSITSLAFLSRRSQIWIWQCSAMKSSLTSTASGCSFALLCLSRIGIMKNYGRRLCRLPCLVSPSSSEARRITDTTECDIANGSLPGGVQKSRMNLWKWSLVIGGVGLVGFASWRLSSRGFKGILSFLPLFRSSGRGEL